MTNSIATRWLIRLVALSSLAASAQLVADSSGTAMPPSCFVECLDGEDGSCDPDEHAAPENTSSPTHQGNIHSNCQGSSCKFIHAPCSAQVDIDVDNVSIGRRGPGFSSPAEPAQGCTHRP